MFSTLKTGLWDAIRPDPATLTGLAVASTLAGTAVSAVGAMRAGQASKNQAEFQSEVLQQQAEQERAASRQEAENVRRENARMMARRRAVMGGAGVETSGSPLLASEDFASEVELQALRTESGGELRASRLEQEGALQRSAGRRAGTAGFMRGGSLLLSGAGQLWRPGSS